MYSLYLDTSTIYLCVGIAFNHKIIFKYQQEAIKKQSELTIPVLQDALSKCNITLNDINEVVITIGPGSFTGIRIGMCIGKVLASLNSLPLIALSSLNSYASLGKKIVILDAKAQRVYLGVYNDNVPQMQECVVELEKIEEILNKYPDYDVVLDAHLIGRDSEKIDVIENMNRIAINAKCVENVDALTPIYLKDR